MRVSKVQRFPYVRILTVAAANSNNQPRKMTCVNISSPLLPTPTQLTTEPANNTQTEEDYPPGLEPVDNTAVVGVPVTTPVLVDEQFEALVRTEGKWNNAWTFPLALHRGDKRYTPLPMCFTYTFGIDV
jgi:hypothetical protein